MKIAIGKFDPETCTVPVTFGEGAQTHQRAVNAVCDQRGQYDAKATRERVLEVAAGVEKKFALGLLTGPESE